MSGTVTASPFVVPSGLMDITINGVTATVAVNSSGYFSDIFDTHLLAASSTPYTITYEFEGDGKIVYDPTGTAASFTKISDNNESLTVGQATLTPYITANGKTYDGGVSVSLASEGLTGVFDGDDVYLTGGVASFDSKNAGLEGVTDVGSRPFRRCRLRLRSLFNHGHGHGHDHAGDADHHGNGERQDVRWRRRGGDRQQDVRRRHSAGRQRSGLQGGDTVTGLVEAYADERGHAARR